MGIFPKFNEDKKQLRDMVNSLLIAGAFCIIAITYLDVSVIGNDAPSMLTFGGVGLTISLMTALLIYYGISSHQKWNKQLIRYTLIYTTLIALVKFTLAPYTIYASKPVLDVDLSKGDFLFGDSSNFNANPTLIAVMGFGLFLMYAIVFRMMTSSSLMRLKKTMRWNEAKVQKFKKTKSGKRTVLTILLILSAVVLTGGMVLFLPLILLGATLSGIEPLSDWVGYTFTAGGGAVVAITLVAAIMFAREAIVSAEEQARFMKSLNFFIVFIWFTISLLAVYHVLWAIYLFILTTFWPFKVYTHGVAPK